MNHPQNSPPPPPGNSFAVPIQACTSVQARLLEIHRATAGTREAREDSQVVLAINRSDYMLDQPSSTMMQVHLSLTTTRCVCGGGGCHLVGSQPDLQPSVELCGRRRGGGYGEEWQGGGGCGRRVLARG